MTETISKKGKQMESRQAIPITSIIVAKISGVRIFRKIHSMKKIGKHSTSWYEDG